ncbi:hypothetical protein [Bartonella pachyuromydis]|uniref:Uncharacterized protein n=1 Tax=Bartonella pachyuromydis TaxID=931097 RepID=A0ABP8VKJ7_9HYPH
MLLSLLIPFYFGYGEGNGIVGFAKRFSPRVLQQEFVVSSKLAQECVMRGAFLGIFAPVGA